MITEAIFKILFLVPNAIVSLIPNIPVVQVGSLTGLLELLSIGNQFFPVDQVILYLSVWLALNFLALSKWFIDWVLTLIPLY